MWPELIIEFMELRGNIFCIILFIVNTKWYYNVT